MPNLSASPGFALSMIDSRRLRRATMRRLGWIGWLGACLMTLVGGLTLGLALTLVGIRHGGEVGAVSVGAWRLSPREGTPAINPYQRAFYARRAAIPMSAGQGIALTALRDDLGRRLDLRCSYAVHGSVPRAGFWTLGAVDTAGMAMSNPAERYAFTSENVLRDGSGAFAVVLSPDVQPGNWLPLAGRGRFTLVLRLYDSVIPGLASRELATLSLPSITPGRCR